MKYAYYPGCAAEGIAREADVSMRLVAKELGIELVDMPDASCCGAGVLTAKDPMLSLALNARIFSTAEANGLDILTICNTCYLVLTLAREELLAKEKVRRDVDERLSRIGRRYIGQARVKHLPQVLVEDLGIETLRKKARRPLAGLKVAAYYGCHIAKPPQVNVFADPENPRALEDIISALGAQAVDHEERVNCCGFHGLLAKEQENLKMIERQVKHMLERGANCCITPCPLCHIALDPYQSRIKAPRGMRLPILHVQQLVGLGLGIAPEKLGLGRHVISPEEIILTL